MILDTTNTSSTLKKIIQGLVSRQSAMALVLMVVVPNALFLMASPWLFLRRPLGPLIFFLAALISLLLPRPFSYPLFLIAAAVDGIIIVSLLFGLPFDTAIAAMRYMSELDVVSSLLYSASIVLLVGIAIISAFLLNRYKYELRCASFIPATAAVVALTWLDLAMNHYNLDQPETFQSALQQSGMTSEAIVRNDRNVLMVLVEGMGAYADPAEREFLEGKLRDAAGARFKLTRGLNTHFGATTGAMSRELCGRWGTFADYLDDKSYDCLPARLAKAGFMTMSYDGFDGNLYSLREWYPRIGIQKMNFRSDIERDYPSKISQTCGTVFNGLCDDDVGNLIQSELAQPDSQRKFVYWLTLNSHLPYTPIKDGPLQCGSDQASITPQIPCELTEIWMRIFDRVASIARDSSMPPLDIVIVGDHNTPMWQRAAAGRFRNGLVDWYKLEYVDYSANMLP